MAERDVARMVEEALADSEAQLCEQVRAYRDLAQAAVRKLAEQRTQINRQYETICQLRTELRERMGVWKGWAA